MKPPSKFYPSTAPSGDHFFILSFKMKLSM
jgi:hypothetical protein